MPAAAFSDPLPLCSAQLLALCALTGRELAWGRRAVSREVRAWTDRAAGIVDGPLRADAFAALTRKRGAIDGAALFWTLLPRRDLRLLRLLVAHELIWDYLDCVSERGACAGAANGLWLHRAIVESLDPERPVSNYYRYHPWQDDGRFLAELVEACRDVCRSLPSYAMVRPLLLQEASRAAVQGLNHDPNPSGRERALRAWAATTDSCEWELRWFELAGAASAPLVIHALLALAAGEGRSREEVAETYAAYFPWVSLATVMLDSYVDQVEDAASGSHSYIAHYGSREEALERTRESVERAARGVLGLRNGHRHAVLIACMVAMYLSKDSARAPELRSATSSLVCAGGSLTRLLVPILRLWRIRYAQQSA